MEKKSRFFLDTANLNEIKKYQNYIDGVTTNPLLLKEAGYNNSNDFLYDFYKSFEKLIVFIQINDEKYLVHNSNMAKNPEWEYDKIYISAKNRTIYKIPFIKKENFELAHTLRSMRMRTCATMVYDLYQVQLALDMELEFCILLYHKNVNHKKLFRNNYIESLENKNKIKFIGASFRNTEEINEVISMPHINYITIKPNLMKQLFNNNQALLEYNKVYE